MSHLWGLSHGGTCHPGPHARPAGRARAWVRGVCSGAREQASPRGPLLTLRSFADGGPRGSTPAGDGGPAGPEAGQRGQAAGARPRRGHAGLPVPQGARRADGAVRALQGRLPHGLRGRPRRAARPARLALSPLSAVGEAAAGEGAAAAGLPAAHPRAPARGRRAAVRDRADRELAAQSPAAAGVGGPPARARPRGPGPATEPGARLRGTGVGQQGEPEPPLLVVGPAALCPLFGRSLLLCRWPWCPPRHQRPRSLPCGLSPLRGPGRLVCQPISAA